MHTHINLARYRVPATNNVSAHCKSKIDIGYCCYYRCCYEYTTTTRFTIHIIVKLPGAVDNDDLIRFDAFSVFLKTHTSLHYKYVCNNTVGVFYINHLKKNSYQSILMMTMILMATTKWLPLLYCYHCCFRCRSWCYFYHQENGIKMFHHFDLQ